MLFIGFGCFILGAIWLLVVPFIYGRIKNFGPNNRCPETFGRTIAKIFFIHIIAGIACLIIGAATEDTSSYDNDFDPVENGYTQEEYDDLVNEYKKPWK